MVGCEDMYDDEDDAPNRAMWDAYAAATSRILAVVCDAVDGMMPVFGSIKEDVTGLAAI